MHLFQCLLVLYNGSESTRRAVQVALPVSRASGGQVLLLRWRAEQERIAELQALVTCEDLAGVQTETSVVERVRRRPLFSSVQSACIISL